MKEDILCRCYTAAAFLDNLRTYTYFSNFLDPSRSGSGMFKLQDSNLHQSQRRPINIPYYTKTRGGIPQFCCHLENTINRKCLDADLCSTKKIWVGKLMYPAWCLQAPRPQSLERFKIFCPELRKIICGKYTLVKTELKREILSRDKRKTSWTEKMIRLKKRD